MPSPHATAPSRRQASYLAGAFFVSSALGLALLAVVARWLTSAQNAEFLALWGLVFTFGSVLGAVEQEVARQATDAAVDGRRAPIAAVQQVTTAAVGSVFVLAVLFVAGPAVVLTTGSPVVAGLVLLSLAGFALQILTRGLMIGQHSLRPYIVVLVGEGVLRLLLIFAVIASGTRPSLVWGAAAIVVGCFSWLPVGVHLVRAVDWSGPRQRWGQVSSTVAALAIANGLSALVLTGFPAVATIAIGSARGLGDLFAVLTFSRVPLVLLAPVQAMAVPAVTRWIRTGRQDRLKRALNQLAGGTVALSGGSALVGYALGPWVTRLMMGDQYAPSRALCAVVLSATCLLAAGLLQAAVLVAMRRYWWLTAVWSVALACAGAILLMVPADAETRAAAGFVTACAVAALATGVAVRVAGLAGDGEDTR